MKIIEPSFQIVSIPDGEEALALIERIGRVAYKSEDKIDPGEQEIVVDQSTEPSTWKPIWKREPSSHAFVRMLLGSDRRQRLYRAAAACPTSESIVDMVMEDLLNKPAHESVIEHCSATVLFTSNRGFTHEAVRHRLCAFTQESTRYCDYNKGKFGGELTVINQHALLADDPTDVLGLSEWQQAMKDCEYHYRNLRQFGFPAQIARGVLPNDLKADIVLTANFREWRHIFRMRCSPAAHPDMRAVMIPVRDEFRRRIPIIFDEV